MFAKLIKVTLILAASVAVALVAYAGAVGGWGIPSGVAVYLVGTLVGLVGGTGVADVMGWLPGDDWE
jgi:hypothetical protein